MSHEASHTQKRCCTAIVIVAIMATGCYAESHEESSTKTAKEVGRAKAIYPQRIIAIAPSSAEVVCALGACDAIVGVSKYVTDQPKLKTTPRVGGLFNPDLEKIIALRPDLVIMRGKNDAIENVCRELSVPIYFDRTDSIAGILQCVTELGQRLGRKKQALTITQEFERRVGKVRRRVRDRRRPRVFVTVSRHPERLADILTAGRGTFLGEMIEIAGGVGLFDEIDMAYPKVSIEAIIAHRPDVILELMPELDLTEIERRDLVTQWQELGSIPAVSHGRVHVITDKRCLIPSPQFIEIIEKISYLIHPEK